jgi:ATP-dependent Clp protease ATP-binding subunit ClpA
MSVTQFLDAECQRALNEAKLRLRDGQPLDAGTMLRALYHSTKLHEMPQLQALADSLPALENPLRSEPGTVRASEEVTAVLQALTGPTGPLELFALLARCPSVQRLLPDDKRLAVFKVAGLPEKEIRPPREAPAAAQGNQRPTPRLEALREFGRLLTDPAVDLGPPPDWVREGPLNTLLLHLLTPRLRNAVLVGPPGVGKTALITALAHRLRRPDPKWPRPLHDLNLFEVSRSFPHGPGGPDGQGQGQDVQRLRAFLRALEANPGVVLYVDQFLPFLLLLHRVSLHQELFEEFKYLLDTDRVACIGSLATQDLGRLADLDPALARRFRVLHLAPPAGAELEQIVRSRCERLRDHYGLREVPPALEARAIALADQHLSERSQPEKTLRLLEEACARAALEGAGTVTDGHLVRAVEDFVGPVLLPGPPLTAEEIYAKLQANIKGQDDTLRRLAGAVVAGRTEGGWFLRSGPRGVFLFGGPTGVGKTETALLLARMLGNSREALVRVDCQNLQGSGTGHDANTLTWRLLGVAPGYVGHVPGCRDGLLCRVRDFPEAVLLLDEFEKADATVGRLLLRILDEGVAQDTEGNDLDFRRCFVVLTTNAGVTLAAKRFGFGRGQEDDERESLPFVTEEDVRGDLMATGLGPEFLARLPDFFLFQMLTIKDLAEVVKVQLRRLADAVRARGKTLVCPEDAVADHLAARAKGKADRGVRFVLNQFRTAVLDPLNAAVLAGQIDGAVREIELLPAATSAPPAKAGRFVLPIP